MTGHTYCAVWVWMQGRMPCPQLRPWREMVRWPVGFALLVASVVGGCSELTGSPGLPAGTPNPSFYNNKAGALGMRNAAVLNVEQALGHYIVDAGLLTDELEDANTGAGQGILLQGSVSDPLDERSLPSGVTVNSYSALQGGRTLIAQALGALATYDTAAADVNSTKVLRGELYAMDGYVEILLADLFCSGVPLSTLDYQKDFTLAPSSTTSQVYQAALAKFDTALTLAAGVSDSVRYLALVGKGRTYLALNNYPAAADDVTTVPDAFRYMISVEFTNPLTNTATVSDSEGQNGLPFLSSHDPRSAVDTVIPAFGNGSTPYIPLTIPNKYQAALQNASGFAPFVLGSGTEARLIQAEKALQGGNATTTTWLTDLNQLRTSGSAAVAVPDTIVDTAGYTGCTSQSACDPNTGLPIGTNFASYTLVDSVQLNVPDPSPEITVCRANKGDAAQYSCLQPWEYIYADPAHTHQVTIWQAGTGGMVGLPSLTDPGTSTARVALLFHERAFWLFLDGHRQGDLRRLLRNYPAPFNDPNHVYPTGLYLAPGTGLYGSDVVAPIPPSEAANPNFHGCLSENP